MSSPYQISKQQGYSDDEILQHLESHPKYSDKLKKSREAGYSDKDIAQFLSSEKPSNTKPKRSTSEKAARIGGQYGLGLAQGAALPYELAVAPLASKDAQTAAYRQTLVDDFERLQDKKSSGDWNEQDQKLYDHVIDQMKDPKKAAEYSQTMDVSIKGLSQKATGLDLEAEGFLEHAANITGLIKDPKKLLEIGMNPSQFLNSIAPTGKEALRGMGAAAGLSIAEDGGYGPIGKMGAIIAGDILGHGAAGVGRFGKRLVTEPKKLLAEVGAAFTSRDKLNVQKELIKDFKEAGLKADLGTMTDSNAIRMIQSRLAQSGLVGQDMKKLAEELRTQVVSEYKELAGSLGEAKYATAHEAGEIAKSGIKEIREADMAATRKLYEGAEMALEEEARVAPSKLGKAISDIEKKLKPGSLKSTEQTTVANTLNKIKNDIYDASTGEIKMAEVRDLIGNKRALNDIINYEAQGGTKQLLKGIVAELDRAIISHGKRNAKFANKYIEANKRFAEHAKTFRNKNTRQLADLHDPAQVMNKMNSVQGIRDLEKIFSKSSQGKEILNGLKRMKLDQVVENNLVDSTTNQIKLGTFSKLLGKGKNRDIVKELLGNGTFSKLEKLSKHAGKLEASSQRFYNASQTASTAADLVAVSTAMKAISALILGNPWMFFETAATLGGIKGISKLITNPEFLSLVEEAILASESGSPQRIQKIAAQIMPYIIKVTEELKYSNPT